MNTFLEQAGRRYYHQCIERASDFTALDTHEHYACMIWSAVAPVDPAERGAFARRLLDSGCTYLVAGGSECERWHDSADQEFINLNLPEPEYSHRFLMTTWHTDESPEEVATYFVNTVFPGETSIEEYSHFLVVQWGGDWLLAERLRAAVAAAAEESVDADSDAGGDDDEAA